MARYFDIQSTVLIVVGYGLLPEQEDRPLAYELQRAILGRARGTDRTAVVLTDIWYLNNEMAQLFPAIGVGGPGVNAFVAKVYEELPVAYQKEQQLFIQMAEEGEKRAIVWGMNHDATRQGIATFINDGLLDRFLDRVWRPRPSN